MFEKTDASELERLSFESFLWVLLILLGVMNIIGDAKQQKYIRTKDERFQNDADKIFGFTLTVAFTIYIYYFIRNLAFFEKASEEKKRVFFVNLIGSALLTKNRKKSPTSTSEREFCSRFKKGEIDLITQGKNDIILLVEVR